MRHCDNRQKEAMSNFTENDDEQVTEATVNGWLSNFRRHSAKFRQDHESLVSGIDKSSKGVLQ
jgi:hypothetical protein